MLRPSSALEQTRRPRNKDNAHQREETRHLLLLAERLSGNQQTARIARQDRREERQHRRLRQRQVQQAEVKTKDAEEAREAPRDEQADQVPRPEGEVADVGQVAVGERGDGGDALAREEDLERVHGRAVGSARFEDAGRDVHPGAEGLGEQDEEGAFVADPDVAEGETPACKRRRGCWRGGWDVEVGIIVYEGPVGVVQLVGVEGKFGEVGVGAVEGGAGTVGCRNGDVGVACWCMGWVGQSDGSWLLSTLLFNMVVLQHSLLLGAMRWTEASLTRVEKLGRRQARIWAGAGKERL